MIVDHPNGPGNLFLVQDCQQCGLYKSRLKIVSPIGPVPCDIVFVGEAPGAEEDEKGVPFVGRAGELFDRHLLEAGIERESTVVTNVVLCRPPGNRNPAKEEIEACQPYLIEVVARCLPKIVVLLGKVAYKAVTGKSDAMKNVCGKPIKNFRIGDHECILLPTYHPAAVLRDPGKNGILLDSLKMAKNLLAPARGGNYVFVDTKKKLEEFRLIATAWEKFSYDFETSGLDPYKDKLLSVAFCGEERKAYCLPLMMVRPWEIDFEQIMFVTKELLTKDAKKAAHNGKFDAGFAKVCLDVNVKNFCFDTMLAASLLEPGRRGYDLGSLVASRFSDLIAYKGEIDRESMEKEWRGDPFRVAMYNCRDADATFRLANEQSHELKDEPGLMNEMVNVLMPVTHTLANIWITGMKLDLDYAKQLEEEFEERAGELLEEIRLATGKPRFNPRSAPQKVAYFIGELGLPVLKKTKTGNPSCDKDVLDEYAYQHPIAAKVKEYVHVKHLVSTYIKPAPTWISGSGRALTNLHQTRAITGRLSSSDPNFQNIPVRSDYGKRIRGIFIAETGYSLVGFDLSQAELRILAWIIQDEEMLAACESDIDLHVRKAMQITGKSADEITDDMRRAAKDANFGVIYGVSAKGLARNAKISIAEAEKIIRDDKIKSPKVWLWVDEQHKFVREHGYITMPYGRRIPVPGIYSDKEYERAAVLRDSQNYPIQGTLSHYLCLGMVDFEQHLKQLPAKIILQVHDELILEVRDDVVAQVIEIGKKCLVAPRPPVDVTMKVDVHVGKRWSDLK